MKGPSPRPSLMQLLSTPLASTLGRWWSQISLSSQVQLLSKCPLYQHCCHAQW